MKTFKFLHFLLISAFLFATIANNSYATELSNCCASISSTDCHSSSQMEDHLLPDESEHQDDHECPSHQHHCCHNHNFLSSSPKVDFFDNQKPLTNISPDHMISDPHTRGPFQPPRA